MWIVPSFRTRCRRLAGVWKGFLLLPVLCLLAASGTAQTFFVAREAAGASDANDGSLPFHVSGNRGPWLTLNHAGQVAQAGDTVLVYDGDYRNESTAFGPGVVDVQNSGLPSRPMPSGESESLCSRSAKLPIRLPSASPGR